MGEHAVRDPGASLELGRGRVVEGVEARIDLGIDSGDEDRGHRPDRGQVVSGRARLLQALEEGFDDVPVPGQGEHESDVDADAGGDGVGDRAQSRLGGGDLDHRVRFTDALPQRLRRFHGARGIVGQRGSDLDRHATVVAVGGLVDGTEQACGLGHIGGGQGLDGGVDVRALTAEFGDRGIVVRSRGDRIREDRRIRRHAGDR